MNEKIRRTGKPRSARDRQPGFVKSVTPRARATLRVAIEVGAQLPRELQAIESDPGLSELGKAQRRSALVAERVAPALKALRTTKLDLELAAGSRAEILKADRPDPLRPLSVADVPESQKSAVAMTNALRSLERRMANERALSVLDNALAAETREGDRTGAGLVAAYRRMIAVGDEPVLAAFERLGPKLLAVDGTDAQRQVFASVIDEERERRIEATLSEQDREALDYADDLAEVAELVGAIAAEFESAKFPTEGSPTLAAARELLPFELLAEEDR